MSAKTARVGTASGRRSGGASTGRRLVLCSVTVGALAGFAAFAWHAYSQNAGGGGENAPPLLKAEAGPVKVRPEDPGGMDPPYQDKFIYDRVAPERAGARPEVLQPQPEEPMTPPAVRHETAAATAAEAATRPGVQLADAGATGDGSTISESERKATVEGATGTEPAAAAKPDAGAEPMPAAAPAASKAVPPEPATPDRESAAKPNPPEAAAPSPPKDAAGATTIEPAAGVASGQTDEQPAAPADQQRDQAAIAPAERTEREAKAEPQGRFRIQVASMRSDEDAASSWALLRSNNKDLLEDLLLYIQRVDLGAEKGIYFRVQAGPFADHAAAAALCAKLRERSVSCLVVKS